MFSFVMYFDGRNYYLGKKISKMTAIKKTKDNKCWCRCGEEGNEYCGDAQ